MTAALEEIMNSPSLPKIAKEIMDKVQEEAEKRARFLKELTPEMKAEFINGQVIMHSPSKAQHIRLTRELYFSLISYTKETGNGEAFSEKCLVSLSRNDYEPDIVWYSTEKAAEIHGSLMRFCAPDFIIEVLSPSTEKVDRGVKMEDYALNGVSEYWIIDPENRAIEQYHIPEGATEYTLYGKQHTGTIHSLAISGWNIDLNALFNS